MVWIFRAGGLRKVSALMKNRGLNLLGYESTVGTEQTLLSSVLCVPSTASCDTKTVPSEWVTSQCNSCLLPVDLARSSQQTVRVCVGFALPETPSITSETSRLLESGRGRSTGAGTGGCNHGLTFCRAALSLLTLRSEQL